MELRARLKTKVKAASWADVEAVLKRDKTFLPTGCINVEAQRGVPAVVVHVGWAETLQPGKKWITLHPCLIFTLV